MIHIFQMTCYVLAALMLGAISGNSLANATDKMTQVEVFTTTDLTFVDEVISSSKQHLQGMSLQLYRLDGTRKIEEILSEGLPRDPESAKRVVLQRIQQLEEKTVVSMRRAATGLAKARQYGINRYPAMVFDGEVVVYGVTDVSFAVERYRAWQTGK